MQPTGTVSPADAQALFAKDPHAPLFLGDGSDDGHGNGVRRMLADATILVDVPLASNVRLVSDPTARTVTLVKSRATRHEPEIREYAITTDGIVLRE